MFHNSSQTVTFELFVPNDSVKLLDLSIVCLLNFALRGSLSLSSNFSHSVALTDYETQTEKERGRIGSTGEEENEKKEEMEKGEKEEASRARTGMKKTMEKDIEN